jgi:hypothetical protein
MAVKTGGFTVETVVQVWNDKTGDRVDVCPDCDALGLVEVRQVHGDGRISSRVTMTPAQALLVAGAITKVASEVGQ